MYLLKEKSEVESVFQNFYTMVLTQFQEKIKIVRSDNGKEYFNKILGNFFLKKGLCIKAIVRILHNRME